MTSQSHFAFVLSVSFLVSGAATAKEKKVVLPKSWGYVAREVTLEARPGSSSRKPELTRLERGALVRVWDVKSQGATSWTKVDAINPARLERVTGWVDSGSIESQPLENYPPDADLLKQLGGQYLEDFAASTTTIARFLVRQGSRERALVCFLGSRALPYARLQVFQRSAGQFVAGPHLEFPASEMKSGITRVEILDLLGDGNECLVTEEPFSTQPELNGVNMVIRRIEGRVLKSLWQAPLDFRNLASFPPRPQILRPPEKNIGTPGTVTTAKVDFRARGPLREPAWKGKIEFHVLGREAPVDTVTFEKVCSWDGQKFAPLR